MPRPAHAAGVLREDIARMYVRNSRKAPMVASSPWSRSSSVNGPQYLERYKLHNI